METLAEAMQRVKAGANLRTYCEGNLRRAPSGNSPFACPACGSGASGRQNSNTAFTITGEKWHCHACERGGDVFDLSGLLNGTEDRAEQCNLVAEWFGMDGWSGGDRNGDRGEAIPWDGEAGTTGRAGAESRAKAEQQDDIMRARYAEGRARHRAYILAAQANIAHQDAMAYLSSRGIDLETARAWGLGYDPDAGGAKDANGAWCKRGRVVIPYPPAEGEAPYYHADRSIDPTAKNQKYSKPETNEVGPEPRWNPGALKAPAFFVVEGQVDALAVAACGYPAIALGKRGDRSLVPEIEATEGAGVAILMLDNDERGREGQAKLAAQFAESKTAYCVEAPTEKMGVKDAGDAWAADKASLKVWLGSIYEQVLADSAKAEEEDRARTLASLGVYDPATVTEDLFTMADVLAPIPTGLARIDGAIGGGLPARGLVVIGAVSSAGKTSLVHQICDNVAASGRPVLFCSIEQGRQEVVAKSLSRIMATMARASGGRIVASAQAITNRAERERWEREDAEKSGAFTAACNVYHERTHRADGTQTLYIMEPERQPTVEEIRRAAEAIRDVHGGQAPLVAVDYAQLLGAPRGLERGTDKQILDRNTLELRQMARDLPTCVIAISSLNRASYAGSIDLSSFKESGMLEYSSDLLIGLQPEGLQDAMRGKSEDGGAAKAKAREIWRDYKEAQQKQVEVVILKNRNGGISKSPCLTFDGMVSTFSESGPARTAKPARL